MLITRFAVQPAPLLPLALKGVPQEALKHLDHEIDRLASLVEVQTGTDIHTLPGAGAAGGLGAALAAFYRCEAAAGNRNAAGRCRI